MQQATRWDVACQKRMTKPGVEGIFETSHAKLVEHIPSRFRLASGRVRARRDPDDKRTDLQVEISDMANAYAGELGELEGEWRPVAPNVLEEHGEPNRKKDLCNGIFIYFVF